MARTQEDKTQSILENSLEYTFELGLHGELIRLNAAARDTLQIRPDNLLKKARLSDLVLIQDSKSLRDCLQTSWRGHKKNITFRVESSRGNV